MGLSFLVAAHEILEESSSTTITHLQGHPAATVLLDEQSKIADEVFLEYLTKPLGVGTFLRQKLLGWRQQLLQEFDANEKIIVSSSQQLQQQHAQKPEARFPSLQARLLSNPQEDHSQFFSISSHKAIMIENDIFEGKVMLVLRPLTPDDDPDFEQRVIDEGATFQIQLQGRFKKPVRKDRLYVGAQLANNKMNLGNLAKRASDLLLMLLSKSMGSNMTYSFGTDKELPHISFPLHTGMEHVVLADEGASIPRIGTPFVESEESKIRRRADDFQDWDADKVYSMSYSAGSIDLPAWKVLFPFEMDLSRFWGDSAMRLVIYEDKGDDEEGEKAYLFNLQLTHLPTPKVQSDDSWSF
jgi:hypothetical protein